MFSNNKGNRSFCSAIFLLKCGSLFNIIVNVSKSNSLVKVHIYGQLLKRILRLGDVLYIHSLDRFGRNKEEIVQEWNAITKEFQADIVVLDMPYSKGEF